MPAIVPHQPLAGKRVLLGVCGGIAAYKAVDLLRQLTEAGAYVIPILTADSLHFVGETTFSALASEPVRKSLWDDISTIPHTELGQTADAIVIAPATARLLANYAAGIADDLLTATLLATRAPVIVCPAMHTEMWEHPAVQDNVSVLRRRGVSIVEPESGVLAGGDIGKGRLAATAAIMGGIEAAVGERDLSGRRIAITAGGTREAIDPVRFIGNRSSGKQGFALARAALSRGALVTLITTTEPPAETLLGAHVVHVVSAEDMYREVMAASAHADVVIMAAAVADFRPKATSEHKLKKADGTPEIVLEPTPDILAELGQSRKSGQILVGFAAETSDVEANAAAKLKAKGVDLVVANDVSQEGAGFNTDTNIVTLLSANGTVTKLEKQQKLAVAHAIFDVIIDHLRSDKS